MEFGVFALIFLVLLLLASGYFSATETALFSLSSSKIKAYNVSSDPRKRLIAKLVLKPRDLLVTVFMLNTLVNILIQNTTSAMYGEEASWLLKVFLPFALMLFLGEIIPKYIGLINNVRLAEIVAPSINFLQRLLKPIRVLIVGITTPVSRYMFFFLRKEKSISQNELKHVLKTSQEHGVLNKDEADLISGYIDLQQATVKQLMRPRDDILFYDIHDPISKLIYLFVDQECTRIPVCDDTLDNMLGVITAADFFPLRHALTQGKHLIPYLHKPLYVPETTAASTFGRQLEQCKQTLALVVDEYGSISGLLTAEDLIEVVIGDIADLRDAKQLYTRAGSNEIIANGRLELLEFNEIFKVELTSENNNMTIGGWLIEQLQEIPKSTSKFELEGFLFHILAADPNKIRKIYIRKLKQADLNKKNTSNKRANE